ncbi:MAG: tetraacyldisaccharide 4'-kinase, partial [Bdellovibrionales bacterium]|nr:tetraacyldisaccharide 4'-kinase [Bdellovibrionales bacterium]
MRYLFLPFSFVYRFLMAIRNQMYDRGLLKVHRVGVPVVSVGNLTMGGTGKTPIICELIGWARDAGLRPAVIS